MKRCCVPCVLLGAFATFACCVLGSAVWAASPTPSPVVLPPGTTSLADIGTYRVAWQSYGSKEKVEMPIGWCGSLDRGTSDPRSGIAYSLGGKLLGRPAVMMHSPWRVPTGRTWVDYPLVLPKTTPIRLSFGIAMSEAAMQPERSDGVTFSCALKVDGRGRELMRQHHARVEWRDYQFDLSEHAGKTVLLRLQVEPGPARNSSFDFSYFGDAKITVGESDAAAAVEAMRRRTASKAYQAAAGADRTALSNRSDGGVTPSNLLPFKNRLERSGDAWHFIYEAADVRMVYAYRPVSGTPDDVTLKIDDSPEFPTTSGSGATVVVQRGGKPAEIEARGGKAVRIEPKGDSLDVVWAYPIEGRSLQIAWKYRIVGKALEVSATCEDPSVARFTLGELGPVAFRKSFGVPYLMGDISYLPQQNVFAGRYLDWTVSNASQCPHASAVYEPKTDGARNPLCERGYIAFSPEVGEVLPNLPSPKSPYLALLGPRLMLDIWGHHKGTYRGDAENLLDLKDHGVDHVAIIQHVWQRYGYDVKLPDHIPADPQFGGDEGMAEFGRAAVRCGYVWSVHENYIDLYPDAPSYDPKARVLHADGKPSEAWFNPGTKVQSFGLKCNSALGFAKQNAPEIHRRYGTTAAYLDVHTCVPPWHQLDHEAGQPMAASLRAKVKYDTELFDYMRKTHEGPLFGEGGNHFYWAGRYDGVEAQVAGGEDHEPFLDFNLLKIHPQAVNHGMGYYERWFRRGYEHRLGVDTGTMEQIDKYRAQTLAYGHAAFIGNSQTNNVQWIVREHHLMHPVQRLYGTSRPTAIDYEVDGRWVTASIALPAGDTSRQRIRYEGGLTLWVNWGKTPWKVEGRELPQWGFLALGPDTQSQTALVDGRFADYAECPEFVFADARTSFSMPYARQPKAIEPRLKSWKHLGGDRVQVVYEWVVGETPDDEYACFVHAVRPGRRVDSAEIFFQQDHPLPKPTTAWRKGDVIVDGPYELRISPKLDEYDLVIGLHHPKKGRLSIEGLEEAGNRIAIARLKLERKDGQIRGVALRPPVAADYAQQRADFRVRLNPPGTKVRFDKVATDGSVKVQRAADSLVVFPYPRERKFEVELDVKALAPKADPAKLRVQALAAGTQADLGPVEFRVQDGRLMWTVGKPGVGRYVIRWQ